MVNIATGPENPSRAALGFLVAKTSAEDGNDTTLFLAADGVAYLREQIRANTTGVGTGSVKEHVDAFLSAGGKVFVSKMSCMARGIPEDALAPMKAEYALPNDLVR